ncbi:hypothetical protein GE09DRAFT_1174765 [Coniochaeta sp. 2T2.1]|nr:hypothetical protein GE09DRAFT_1174765 [Coniochaeta sp. 2T2.1]
MHESLSISHQMRGSDLPCADEPLFDYEQVSVTDDTLEALLAETNATQHAALFAIDNGKTLDPRLLAGAACKVFPGDAEWPSPPTWDIFDKLLGGALIETVPVAAPCYKNLGLYDAGKCAIVRDNFTNPYFQEDDPTSIFWPLYQGRTCLPTPDPDGSNCTHGGFPVYAVNVSSVSHIQLAINFARNSDLRLVIKNTGHCYLGKSSGAGALSIWTHNLKNIAYYPHLDVPAYSGPAMKIGAGVTSVGYAGGYIAGGGHTPLSGLYGMAADHVMALEVVTADGRFITASAEENADLYWALRGGGGSTFGVVTSIIIRVHPKVPVTTSVFSFRTSDKVSADTFWEGVRTYFSLFIPFTDAGTYSWFTLLNLNGSYSFDMGPFFAPNHTIESFNVDVGLNAAGRISVPGNRLLPRANWEDPAKFNATFAVIRNQSEAGRRLYGYHQAPRNRANADNAVNSAFRQVICFLVFGGTLAPNPTPAQVKAASEELQNEIIAPFRAVATESEGGGAYLNEANVDEPQWQAAFYGTHYPRLLELKRKYDPKDVFYATTAVGSERWEVRDGEQGVQTQNGRLCRL